MNTSTKVSNNSIAQNLSTENLPNEVWKDIHGFIGRYKISNYGRVKSIKITNQIICCRILKTQKLKNGYYEVNLFKGSKRYHRYIHRLVAASFIQNTKDKPCVNHVDGIKTNNRVENLEWCTYSENNKHAYRKGLKTGNRRFTSKQITEIRKMIKSGDIMQKDIAKKFGVVKSVITDIKNETTYKVLLNN